MQFFAINTVWAQLFFAAAQFPETFFGHLSRGLVTLWPWVLLVPTILSHLLPPSLVLYCDSLEKCGIPKSLRLASYIAFTAGLLFLGARTSAIAMALETLVFPLTLWLCPPIPEQPIARLWVREASETWTAIASVQSFLWSDRHHTIILRDGSNRLRIMPFSDYVERLLTGEFVERTDPTGPSAPSGAKPGATT